MGYNVQSLKTALAAETMPSRVESGSASVVRDVMVSSQTLHKKVTVNQ
jgi:hypothetical protein